MIENRKNPGLSRGFMRLMVGEQAGDVSKGCH